MFRGLKKGGSSELLEPPVYRPDDVYHFSKKSAGTYTSEKLHENLLTLLHAPIPQASIHDKSTQTALLVGKRVSHTFTDPTTKKPSNY